MKILYIVRGLPGSGKSTLAQVVAPNANCAADDWMVDKGGKYDFNPARLKHCHENCQRQVLEWMKDPLCNNVAVHNTFSQKWEAEPYVKMAEENDYSVCVIECQSDYGNVHNVPQDAIERMRQRWENL